MKLKQSLSLSLLIFSIFQISVSHASSFYTTLSSRHFSSNATWATTSPGVAGSGWWLQDPTNPTAVACSSTPTGGYGYTTTNNAIPSGYPLSGTYASVTC